LKITNISAAMAAAAMAAAGIIGAAPIAFADDSAVTTEALGSQAKLDNGNVGWTVTDLKPSTDTIPYQVHGTLWEVTATNEALEGSVTPIVSNFNARAADGKNYRALFQVATPQGVNPATISQGEKTSGKVYFDVTEADPTTVVYNSGGRDIAVWNKPAAAPVTTGGTGNPVPLSSHPAQVPAAAPAVATPAPAATPAAPLATPAGAGSRATDLPAAAEGATPVPAGTQTAPAPAGAPTTPAAVPGTTQAPAEGAVPASNGTPVPAGAPAAVGTTPAPAAGPTGAGNAATAVPPAEQAPAGTPTVPAANPAAPAPAAPAAPVEPTLVPAGAQPTTTAPAAPVSNHGPTS
jgi:hypothetical protein